MSEKQWILTIVESPFSGDIAKNDAYLNACMADAIARGESPYASHGLLTRKGVLDDGKPEERKRGIEAGFAWGEVADQVVFYVDLGWSRGMLLGFETAKARGSKIRTRTLGAPWSDLAPSDARCLT